MARKKAANEVPPGSVDLGGEAAAALDAPEAPKTRRRAQTKPEEGDVDVKIDSFLEGQAKEDRKSTKAKHVDDGLKAVAEMVDRMKKGIAYAGAVHDVEVKLTVLTEVADTAAAVVDDARRAVRNAQKENRNLQPAT